MKCSGKEYLGWEACGRDYDPKMSTLKAGGETACKACLPDLLRQARTDELTGLSNIREFSAQTNRLIDERKPFGVIQMDLINFSFVNNTYSHNMGDQILKYTAEFLRASTRNHASNNGDSLTDSVLSRRGGDEFLITAVLTERGSGKDVENSLLSLGNMAMRLRESYSNDPFIASYNQQLDVVASQQQLGMRTGISAWEEGKELVDLLLESDPKANPTPNPAKQA